MIWKNIIATSAFVCLSTLAAQTLAVQAGDAAYSAKDIVSFFNDQQKTRGICVGTEEECGFADKKPAGFNLRLSFEKNSATLTQDAMTNLGFFAEALKSDSLKTVKFGIEGYTDASGSDGYNQSLSVRRAETVVAYLTELGVDKGMLEPKGFGEAAPIAGDPQDPANRRVETRLIFQ